MAPTWSIWGATSSNKEKEGKWKGVSQKEVKWKSKEKAGLTQGKFGEFRTRRIQVVSDSAEGADQLQELLVQEEVDSDEEEDNTNIEEV